VERIARLGLIGFVFSGWSGRFFVVIACWEGSCVDFGVLGIGFVLHKCLTGTGV